MFQILEIFHLRTVRVIPLCDVNKILAEYPSDDGQYVGFKDGIESSEIDFSWVGDVYIVIYIRLLLVFLKKYV